MQCLTFFFPLLTIAKCSPGQYSDTGLAPCAPCPRDFYQPLSGQLTCSECPTNMRTAGPGAVGRDECEPIQCSENACQHGGLCIPMGKTQVYVFWYQLSVLKLDSKL